MRNRALGPFRPRFPPDKPAPAPNRTSEPPLAQSGIRIGTEFPTKSGPARREIAKSGQIAQIGHVIPWGHVTPGRFWGPCTRATPHPRRRKLTPTSLFIISSRQAGRAVVVPQPLGPRNVYGQIRMVQNWVFFRSFRPISPFNLAIKPATYTPLRLVFVIWTGWEAREGYFRSCEAIPALFFALNTFLVQRPHIGWGN